jgi:hypothetical protein
VTADDQPAPESQKRMCAARGAAPDRRPVSEGDFAIAWRAPSRRALARLPEKVATVAVEFVYGSLAADPHRVDKQLKLGLAGHE